MSMSQVTHPSLQSFKLQLSMHVLPLSTTDQLSVNVQSPRRDDFSFVLKISN